MPGDSGSGQKRCERRWWSVLGWCGVVRVCEATRGSGEGTCWCSARVLNLTLEIFTINAALRYCPLAPFTPSSSPRGREPRPRLAMPEDEEPERVTSPLPMSDSPNSVATERSESSNQAEDGSPLAARQRQFVIVPEDQQLQAPSTLHPYTRPLTISDLDSCIALENAAFSDPRDRATPEKFRYRLSKCGELCLGIFCTIEQGPGPKPATFATGKPVETSRKNGAICVLIGHVIASKTNDPTASDDSMGVPADWDSESPKPTKLGHKEAGRTIALHSVAILPDYQGRGIGRVLMMAYMQQMNGSGIADRLALIAHDHKTEWYEKMGFTNKGLGAAQFGSGGWYDLIFELKTLEARAAYG